MRASRGCKDLVYLGSNTERSPKTLVVKTNERRGGFTKTATRGLILVATVLRKSERRTNGKAYLDWSVVENKRLGDGRAIQRPQLDLGEIASSQAEAWRKAIAAFDADGRRSRAPALFPEDRRRRAAADDVIRLRLSEMRLCRPRPWGARRLAGVLWRELQRDRVSAERLPRSRKGTRWGAVPHVLATDRRIAPWRRMAAASPRVPRQRHGRSAGIGFRPGRGAQALRPPRSPHRPQTGAVPAIGLSAGAIRSTPPSTCCFTTWPARISRSTPPTFPRAPNVATGDSRDKAARKGDLAIRPIFHHDERRIEAHIFLAFLAYRLQVALTRRLNGLAPGLAARKRASQSSPPCR